KGLTGMVGEPGKSPELTAVGWPYGSATSMGYPGHSLAQPSGGLARRRYQPRAGAVDQGLLFPSDRFCRDRGGDLPPRPCYFSRNGGGAPPRCALGRPVWVPLTAVPAQRWLLSRDDSPWYPTMRLFRQTTAGDWAPVVDSLASCLAEMVHREG